MLDYSGLMDGDESGNKRKRVTIGVDDMYNVFQRFPAPTVITLYQEIGKFGGAKIDWNEMVKRTETGIKSAREYQMLWRHLAYGHPLEEMIEDGAEPLDDESDLETDVEAMPPGSANMVAEARECVKVMIGSRLPSYSTMLNGERNAQLGLGWKQLKPKNYPGQKHPNEQVENANNAMSMALDGPVNLKSCSVRKGWSSASVQAITCRPLKDHSLLTKPPVPMKSSVSPILALPATAMAAGARIANSKTAELLLKPALANNALHISLGGGPVIKSGSVSPLPSSNTVAPPHSGAGLAATTHPSSLAVMSSVSKVDPPAPIINFQSKVTTVDKSPSLPGAEESIRNKEVVNEACKKQSQRVHDQSCEADNPKE